MVEWQAKTYVFYAEFQRAFRCHNCFLSYRVAHKVFFPPNVHFVPFVIYMRARFLQKLILYRLSRAKLTYFVEFEELSDGAFACQLIMWRTGVFSRQMSIFRLFSKKKIEK